MRQFKSVVGGAMALQIDMEVYDSRGKYVDALKDHNGLTMTDDDTGKGVAKQSWADFSGSGLEDPYGLTAVHIKYRDPILTSVFDELKKNISAGDRGFASDEIGALKTLGVTFQKIGDGRGGDASTKSVSTKSWNGSNCACWTRDVLQLRRNC